MAQLDVCFFAAGGTVQFIISFILFSELNGIANACVYTGAKAPALFNCNDFS